VVHHNQINVLFTSVGRRVELLRAFRKAYQQLDLEGNIVAVDIDPLAPALQVADCPYLVPCLTDAAYISTLEEICRREKVNLVFPLIDPDIPVLAQHRAVLEATGVRLAVVSSAAAALANDKWQTTHFFRRLGLPTAHAWLPHELEATQIQYPLFIKPRSGSAAKHTYTIHNADELAFFSRYVPDPVIEEFLPGPEITSDVVTWLDGRVLGVVSRQRIEVRWGEVAKGKTIYDAQIISACVKIAEALPAVGPFTVQCIFKEGIPHFTEINARFGGGAPLGIRAGVDSPRWLLALAAGIPVEIPPLGEYQTNLYLTRFDDSFVLSEKDLETIRGSHL